MLAGWGKLTDPVILDVQCEDTWYELDKGNCPEWSRDGECQKNPDFMLKHCRKSCKVCKGTGKKKKFNFYGWALRKEVVIE